MAPNLIFVWWAVQLFTSILPPINRHTYQLVVSWFSADHCGLRFYLSIWFTVWKPGLWSNNGPGKMEVQQKLTQFVFYILFVNVKQKIKRGVVFLSRNKGWNLYSPYSLLMNRIKNNISYHNPVSRCIVKKCIITQLISLLFLVGTTSSTFELKSSHLFFSDSLSSSICFRRWAFFWDFFLLYSLCDAIRSFLKNERCQFDWLWPLEISPLITMAKFQDEHLMNFCFNITNQNLISVNVPDKVKN